MYIRNWIVALTLSLFAGVALAADGLKAGEDYAVISPAVSMAGNDKIQVVELFWYGCPACYKLEPHLEEWLKNKPEHVEFVRLPAIFNNPAWVLHARAYYTAEALGIVEDFHAPFFHAMHRFGKRMQSEAEIRDFFVSAGVTAENFDKNFSSFAVESRVRRAADLTRQYGIGGVPALAINGKYVVDGPMAKTYENMFATVNKLAEQEAMAIAAQ